MAEPRIFSSPDELPGAIGEPLGPTEWLLVDQRRIDQFAEATGDHQWIHTHRERAATGPFGATIAHGYLTLALLPVLTPQLLRVEGVRMALNYGSNRVRFPAPLPVDSRVRAHGSVVNAEPVPGGWQLTLAVTVEREGGARPVCAAETLTRFAL
ncbi:MaoC family dehydratase [Streptomyces sedi]|uniref:MaoC family dehydratase n=1 Tax=Streptomyces sedi TaxID=555059 RepID=A0A5C4URX1_9ACTN|nr:MaoC family dehydratase [Streptomyces sedi]TNM26351.1 MaoC family dehydratase [Streptomyces sedi]